MTIATTQALTLTSLDKAHTYVGRFRAMGSSCEAIMSGCSLRQANTCLQSVFTEARRIEQKFTRFSDDSVTADINRSRGRSILVDDETARLLDCADELYRISDGLFDITSGCLRKVWQFDQSDRVPDPADIESLLPYIGWHNVRWNKPEITLPEGVELDFGGIGKEYAADSCLSLATQCDVGSVLVNLGGDIAASGPQADGEPWKIGIESLQGTCRDEQTLLLDKGGVATSGDARQFLEKDHIRYSHVLDPRSGWPVRNTPASITTIGSNCTEAGICSTLAMLYGPEAEKFLSANQVEYWIQHRETTGSDQYT